MPFVEHNQAHIWYGDDGDGRPVLLVHGGLFDPMNGERFWKNPGIVEDLVAAGYRTLVPDRRFSVGRTTAAFAVHSWDVEADDLVAVLHAADVAQADVVAGSNGCSAAFRLVLDHPQLVRTLVLCWPASPHNDALHQAFERSATLVEQIGPTAYFNMLRQEGVPHPNEARAGVAWGLALLHDEHLAASFRQFAASEAAAIIRATAANLLRGELLRGLWENDTQALGQLQLRVAVVPADPENRYHPRAVADGLVNRIPHARLLRGFPESPLPYFAHARADFSTQLLDFLRH